jgi:flagellar biosynthesis GTPase FlhF
MSDSNNGTSTNPESAPDQRAEINRTNSQHSTGPRTSAGKQRSSLNALRHGLTGHVIVLPSEDHAAYDHHIRRLFDDLQPKGALEEQLVQSLSDTSWRINRIAALETNLLALGIHEQSNNIDTAHPEVHTALAMAAAVREQTRALSNLSSHEHRLSRQFERTLQQLREIQAERREKEKDQMEKAAKILQLHQAEGTPYNPAEDGFVFSNDEIETSIRRNHRLRDANNAYYASTA